MKLAHVTLSIFQPALREHVKKLAFLAGLSAKALTPPPPLVSGRNKGIYASFFLNININTFLKPAKTNTENGIKVKNVTKNHVQRKLENRKSEILNVPE